MEICCFNGSDQEQNTRRRERFAAFLLLLFGYGFVELANQTSHTSKMNIPLVCPGISTKFKAIYASLLVTSTLLSIVIANAVAYFLDGKLKLYRFTLVLSCFILLLSQAIVFATDLETAGQFFMLFETKFKDDLCEKFGRKFYLNLAVLSLSNVSIIICQLTIYSLIHKYVKMNEHTTKQLVFAAIFSGYLSQIFIELAAHHSSASFQTRSSSLQPTLVSTKSCPNRIRYLANFFATLFSVMMIGLIAACLIKQEAMIEIRAQNHQTTRLHAHKDLTFSITTIAIFALASTHYNGTNNVNDAEPDHEATPLHSLSFLAHAICVALGVLPGIYLRGIRKGREDWWILKRHHLKLLAHFLILLCSITIYTLHILPGAKVLDDKSTAVPLIVGLCERLMRLYALMRIVERMLGEDVPNETLNFSITLLSSIAIIPMSLLPLHKNIYYYGLTRGIALIALIGSLTAEVIVERKNIVEKSIENS